MTLLISHRPLSIHASNVENKREDDFESLTANRKMSTFYLYCLCFGCKISLNLFSKLNSSFVLK